MKMFEEIILPRLVSQEWWSVMEDLTSLIKAFNSICQNMESTTMSLLRTTLRQVARQKHQTSKSRIFFRRRSMKWEHHGRIGYLMLCGV
jgi:hypothetical protein